MSSEWFEPWERVGVRGERAWGEMVVVVRREWAKGSRFEGGTYALYTDSEGSNSAAQ